VVSWFALWLWILFAPLREIIDAFHAKARSETQGAKKKTNFRLTREASGVLLVCCRGISPTVREGSVAIRAGPSLTVGLVPRSRRSNTILTHYSEAFDIDKADARAYSQVVIAK